MSKTKVAVIGGGIAGIMAAYLLQKKYQVTLFEAQAELGGHAHAVTIDNGHEPIFEVDTGFLVFNDKTYPLFLKFLKALGATTHIARAEMSFAFSDLDKDLHFTLGCGFNACFYQKKNLFNIAFYRMFLDLLHFRKRAYRDLEQQQLAAVTLGEYVAQYSSLFRENLLAPTAAAVWSLPAQHIWDFPAETYLRFQHNHQYLQGSGWKESAWYSFQKSSRQYIHAFAQQFTGEIRLNEPIAQVIRSDSGVEVLSPTGQREQFSQVVLATHANTALQLLAQPSGAEQKLLGAWQYYPNRVTLHTDKRFVHPDRSIWASWNLQLKNKATQITYYLNRVQNLQSALDYFITLNDAGQIAPEHLLAQFEYLHPIYTFDALRTQSELPSLNGPQTYFCGSYFGYGFHEDSVRSAVQVGEALGVAFS